MLVCLLSHAALVFGTYRLGAAVFGRWSGALAALFVAASASFLLYAARGYVDAPFLALVVWAGVLAARTDRAPLGAARPRGPAAPRGVGAHGPAWLWRGRPGAPRASRRRCAIVVVLAPLFWALTDLVVTGDPLHSLHATSELADDLGRVRGLQHVPARSCRSSARPCARRSPLLAPIGGVLAWRLLGWERMRVPLALFAAGVITFVGTGVLGPLDPPALPDRPRGLAVPVRRLRAASASRRSSARTPGAAAGRGLGGRDGRRRHRPDHPRAVADQRARGDALHPRHPRLPDRDCSTTPRSAPACAAER